MNSDDPAYFGGYVAENFRAVQNGLHLQVDDIYELARNSFRALFLPLEKKRELLEELDSCSGDGEGEKASGP